MDDAIKCQDIVLVKYLHRNGVKWNIHFAHAIATKGNITLLQYLNATGWKWNEDIIQLTIKNGHVSAVKYLLDNGCPIQFGNRVRSLTPDQYMVVLEISGLLYKHR